jgi:hypothetical protein
MFPLDQLHGSSSQPLCSRWLHDQRITRSVPDDLRGSSLIGRVEKHQWHIRVLKQESRGHDRTWSALATVGAFSRRRKTDLGEVSNSGALVNNWRHELMDWVLDYLAEPTTCSIYRIPEWWPMNLRWRRGGQRKKRGLSQEIGGFHRGELTGDHQKCVIWATETW